MKQERRRAEGCEDGREEENEGKIKKMKGRRKEIKRGKGT